MTTEELRSEIDQILKEYGVWVLDQTREEAIQTIINWSEQQAINLLLDDSIINRRLAELVHKHRSHND